MKNIKSNLFDKKNVLDKINMESIYGGANKSDINYSDSKKDGGGWDIAVNSLIDVVDSSRSLDKPEDTTTLERPVFTGPDFSDAK